MFGRIICHTVRFFLGSVLSIHSSGVARGRIAVLLTLDSPEYASLHRAAESVVQFLNVDVDIIDTTSRSSFTNATSRSSFNEFTNATTSSSAFLRRSAINTYTAQLTVNSIDAFLNLTTRPGRSVSAVVGPAYSFQTAPLLPLAWDRDVPLVSYGVEVDFPHMPHSSVASLPASNELDVAEAPARNDELTQQAQELPHYAFYRVNPSLLQKTRALIQFLDHFGWRRIAVLFSADPWGQDFLQSLLRISPSSLELVALETVALGADAASYDRSAAKLRDCGATIFVLQLFTHQFELAVPALKRHGLVRKGKHVQQGS